MITTAATCNYPFRGRSQSQNSEERRIKMVLEKLGCGSRSSDANGPLLHPYCVCFRGVRLDRLDLEVSFTLRMHAGVRSGIATEAVDGMDLTVAVRIACTSWLAPSS